MINVQAPVKRAYLDAEDIKNRYGIGINNAYSVIKAIQRVCGGGKLGPGKVLPSEVTYWESRCKREEQDFCE